MDEKIISFVLPTVEAETLRGLTSVDGTGGFVKIPVSKFKAYVKKITASMAKDEFSSEEFNIKTRLLTKLTLVATENGVELISPKEAAALEPVSDVVVGEDYIEKE